VGRITETVTTINSTLRTFMGMVILGMLGTTGYFVWERIHGADQMLVEAKKELALYETRLKDAGTKISVLETENAQQAEQILRIETAMHLLKTDQRLAKLEVLSQVSDETTGDTTTTVRFTELSPDGDAIGAPREFTLRGSVVYFDNWVVKFDDQYVEEADLLRGTSLTLFRRVFGEFQMPSEGFVLDAEGVMPQAYNSGGEPNEFAQEIWRDFWTFANNPELAQTKGIRAAHGEAVSMKVEPGKTYRIVLRASDGLSIIPESPPK
jgi:hypothetical protein